MDNMGPRSPVQHQAFVKGAQQGATASAENVILYWMAANPAAIMYVSATDDLLDKWVNKRLEPAIDSCGLRGLFSSPTVNRSNRRTGDKTFLKQFPGGSLTMTSAQSPAGLRGDTVRVLIRDEIDGCPRMLTTGEGDWLEVSRVRTNGFGHRRKIFDLSTPTLFGESAIWDQFEAGDQRYYFVPCPICGKYQVLKWDNVRPESVAGKVQDAYYLCEFCHDAIFHDQKAAMLTAGRWEPAKPWSDEDRSYQLSTMYSPHGMVDWKDMYLESVRHQEKNDMRSFVNLYLGLPFKDEGSRPDLKTVIELRGPYKAGMVPDGVLYLTVGIDVQRGSGMDPGNPTKFKDPEKPPRLELEVLGHGLGYRTWSIDYKVFTGSIADPFSGAWEKLHQWAVDGGLTYSRRDGVAFDAKLIFIDSGDGESMDIVYRFCNRWQNTYPSKGLPFVKVDAKKREKGDIPGSEYRKYRFANVGGDQSIYEINTRHYKRITYNNLKVKRTEMQIQPPGFCEFPYEYDEKYFDMLRAEEQRSDGTFYCPSGRRNEALDCRVYALCAGDVWLDAETERVRKYYRDQGLPVAQVQQITGRTVLDMIAARLAA